MKKKIIRLNQETLAKIKCLNKSPITPDELEEYLAFMGTLPIVNKDAIFVRNKRGVLYEVVGQKGTVKRYQVDYKKGVFYFDGNRLGKRKHQICLDLFENGGEYRGNGNPEKVWKKIEKHSLCY